MIPFLRVTHGIASASEKLITTNLLMAEKEFCYSATHLSHSRKQETAWFSKGKESVSHSVVSLSDPMDYRLPGSSVHGILQARILEWVAISFSSQ